LFLVVAEGFGGVMRRAVDIRVFKEVDQVEGDLQSKEVWLVRC
jgi:hypothetical protein